MRVVSSSRQITATAAAALILSAITIGAQRPESSHTARIDSLSRSPFSIPDSGRMMTRPGPALWWMIGGSLVVAAALSDHEFEEESLEYRTATLDTFAHTGDVLGAGRYLLPALGLTYLSGVVTRQPQLKNGALHVGAAYLAGNIVGSVGKPAIGRHRPDTTGSPWRFHHFASEGEWHSLPSAHTLHAFTLAGAISEEAHRPWVTVATYSVATLVGWSRVYADEHWASDVALSAVLGAAIGHGVVRFLHARGSPRGNILVRPGMAGAEFSVTF